MDVAALLAGAEARAGAGDYGPDAAAMHEALEVLVRSANDEAGLGEQGEMVFAGMIDSLLVRRLQIEQCYAAHPEIDDQQIESVLFGLGLPRTGSTALSYLLAQDPAVRNLRVWEASQPTPPPELATEATDPRFLAAQEMMHGLGNLPPELKSMLPSSPDGPSECLEVMNLTFRCSQLDVVAQTPSYGEWLMDCDYGPAYRYHERVLKLLQWHRPPNRWRLKSPAHMFGIDDLDAVYPQSRFVITHRDVTKVIPSVASVETAVVRMYTGTADPLYFGKHCEEAWDVGLRRFIAFRDRVGEERFYDIAFDDLQSDPVGTVRGLYEWLGEDLPPSTAAAMQAWWDESQSERESGGGHHYTPEDFGLDVDELAERFAYYAERFPIARARPAR
jgi:hypothetical protein